MLDLGCGPGFYTGRLAKLGHACVGIDFSPASVAYAREHAQAESLRCEYRLGDLLRGDYGSDFDAVLLLSGELNTFARPEATRIVAEAKRALTHSGALVVEVHPEDAVRARAEPSSASFSAERSVFSDEPHVCVIERRFDPESRTSQERFLVSPVAADGFRVFTSSTRAYSTDELETLLTGAGFPSVERFPSLTGTPTGAGDAFIVLVCRDPNRA